MRTNAFSIIHQDDPPTSKAWRILETYTCSDGIRSRICDGVWATFHEAQNEVRKRSTPVAAESSVAPAPWGSFVPHDSELGKRLLAAFNDGKKCRVGGPPSRNPGNSVEHCLHAAGWVAEDLRQALIKADPNYAAAQASYEERKVV